MGGSLIPVFGTMETIGLIISIIVLAVFCYGIVNSIMHS